MFITEDGENVCYKEGAISTSYSESTYDSYLNETWYNKLNTGKNAIVKSNITVYSYSTGDVYNSTTHASYVDYTSKTKSEELERFVYALDIEDIEEYFKTDSSNSQGVFSKENLKEFIGYRFYSKLDNISAWLRSGGIGSSTKFYISSGIYDEADMDYTFLGLASFTIDLSKIDWTLSA